MLISQPDWSNSVRWTFVEGRRLRTANFCVWSKFVPWKNKIINDARILSKDLNSLTESQLMVCIVRYDSLSSSFGLPGCRPHPTLLWRWGASLFLFHDNNLSFYSVLHQGTMQCDFCTKLKRIVCIDQPKKEKSFLTNPCLMRFFFLPFFPRKPHCTSPQNSFVYYSRSPSVGTLVWVNQYLYMQQSFTWSRAQKKNVTSGMRDCCGPFAHLLVYRHNVTAVISIVPHLWSAQSI